jgi:hypothetical protein
MIIGWKRHFMPIIEAPQERRHIIVLDELPEKKEEVIKRHNHKICKALCLSGKPCKHKPQTGLEFCKRHLKINDV